MAGAYVSSLLAYEIRRVVRAPAAFVIRGLRIRTQEARATAALAESFRGDHLLRRHARLHPALQRRGHIVIRVRERNAALSERARSRSSRAMLHPGDHEETYGFPGVLLSHFLEDAVVIVDRVTGGDGRVAPAVEQDQLAAALLERRQIGIVG